MPCRSRAPAARWISGGSHRLGRYRALMTGPRKARHGAWPGRRRMQPQRQPTALANDGPHRGSWKRRVDNRSPDSTNRAHALCAAAALAMGHSVARVRAVRVVQTLGRLAQGSGLSTRTMVPLFQYLASRFSMEKRKKPGPKPTTGPGKSVNVRCHESFLKQVDAWRATQPGLPTRPQAIIRLAELGLTVKRKQV